MQKRYLDNWIYEISIIIPLYYYILFFIGIQDGQMERYSKLIESKSIDYNVYDKSKIDPWFNLSPDQRAELIELTKKLLLLNNL